MRVGEVEPVREGELVGAAEGENVVGAGVGDVLGELVGRTVGEKEWTTPYAFRPTGCEANESTGTIKDEDPGGLGRDGRDGAMLSNLVGSLKNF